MTLEGKVALVTGASSGIGRIIALKMAEAGAKVAVNYIDIASIKADAEAVVKEITDKGGVAAAVAADVSKEESVEAMIKEIEEKLGTVDILVNNAGITQDGLIMRMKVEQWEKVLDVNLKGAFICTKAALKGMMKKRYGKIVNIASVVGFSGNAGQANYSASKAGLVGLTKTSAQELASRGIRVNAVAPGFIRTAMTDVLPKEVVDAMLAKISLNALGEADDVANAVMFLASAESDYITGQTIHVNGGMYM
ncbi:3-oxoacyl-[acyl-carrier-protein] reductase [Seleniivibrio woodruffii]|uniref:3-oxoacyl-[acyl-carrier-protein] reductase n=1 Tax=Seleniivibrio woodruffii TaxID=1078050 RepID=A0A4R1KAY6_9BACT|nr:3-oxoacyl-[acyl-carrier-protein] reductase [Seleniivibrio woodruffii]TCK61615.1 3-oxoacyl-[acyl-carrier-protein] reductase [Seleniivibrio woodruffii]TVZ35270.1 3-oxoacyl-[acyl-carrier-protein] reductase [Seleniivibrio woodruffii]